MDTVMLVRVILSLDRTNYPNLIVRGQDIYTGIEAHPSIFLNPNPSVAQIKGNVDDLVTAQQAVRNRTLGAVELRLVRANTLVSTLVASQGYVQGIIATSPADQGPMIAKAAGMVVAESTAHSKPMLKVTQEMPGAPVHLDVHVSLLTGGVKGKVFFNWQLSGDGGQTWLTMPSTPHGNTDVSGLTALSTYLFRVSVTSRKGLGPWTEPVSFLVH